MSDLAYLEDVLKSMKDKTDVIIMLSSFTYNEWSKMEYQDGLGNHHVVNWLDAVEQLNLNKSLVVNAVKVDQSPYSDKPQWTITLANKKTLTTDLFDQIANEIACERSCRLNNHV
jgi:hypothetical protein